MKIRIVSFVLCLCLCGCLFGCGATSDTPTQVSEVTSSVGSTREDAPTVSDGTVTSDAESQATTPSVSTNHMITIDSTTASAGEQITLAVTISDNVNVAAMDLDIRFDPTVLSYNSCANGSCVNGALALGDITKSGNFHFTMATLTPVATAGTLFTVTFTVSGDAKPGTTDLELSQTTFCDFDSQDIPISFTNGTVTIK